VEPLVLVVERELRIAAVLLERGLAHQMTAFGFGRLFGEPVVDRVVTLGAGERIASARRREGDAGDVPAAARRLENVGIDARAVGHLAGAAAAVTEVERGDAVRLAGQN